MNPLSIRESHTAQKLTSLYTLFWNLCAGWNRVCFRGDQIAYILRNSKVRFALEPLGELDGLAMVADGHYIVCLNRRLAPRVTQHMIDQQRWREVGSALSAKARFVFIHEIAHLILHSDEPAHWESAPGGSLKRARWSAERSFASRNPRNVEEADRTRNIVATLREVEADFCALVALVPDQELADLERNKRLNIDEVLRFFRGPLDSIDDWGPSARDLAQYRIDLYRKFSYLFWSISSTVPIENLPWVKSFYDVLTLNMRCVPRRMSTALRRSSIDSSLADIAVQHPLVKACSDVRLAVETGLCAPFEILPACDGTAGDFGEWTRLHSEILSPCI